MSSMSWRRTTQLTAEALRTRRQLGNHWDHRAILVTIQFLSTSEFSFLVFERGRCWLFDLRWQNEASQTMPPKTRMSKPSKCCKPKKGSSSILVLGQAVDHANVPNAAPTQ